MGKSCNEKESSVNLERKLDIICAEDLIKLRLGDGILSGHQRWVFPTSLLYTGTRRYANPERDGLPKPTS